MALSCFSLVTKNLWFAGIHPNLFFIYALSDSLVSSTSYVRMRVVSEFTACCCDSKISKKALFQGHMDFHRNWGNIFYVFESGYFTINTY